MTSDKAQTSRRTVLTSAGAAALATVAVAAPATAQSGTYVDKTAVDYKSEPHVRKCSTCLHWNNSACRVVQGADNPEGWCRAHTPT